MNERHALPRLRHASMRLSSGSSVVRASCFALALLTVHGVLAQTTIPAAESDTRWMQAKEIVARGEALFRVGDYEGSLSEFTRAYQLLEGHPRQYIVLHNLAVCHERMFRYDLAMSYYERYLNEGDAGAEDAAEVRGAVRALRGLLAKLRIRSNVPSEVWIDDRQVGRAPAEIWLPTGHHVLELRAPLYEPARREIMVSARETLVLSLKLKQLSTFRGSAPAYFWSSVAVSVAAIGLGTVFGVSAVTKSDGAQRDAELHKDVTAQRDTIRRLSLQADVCFGVGALFGVASVALFALGDWAGTHENEATRPADSGTREVQLRTARAPADVRLLPVASASSVGVVLGGRF